MSEELTSYAPDFPSEQWSKRDRELLEPFATNLDGFVSVLRNLPPELVGALCSRASRAADSLVRVLLKEYIYPIIDGEDKKLAQELLDTIAFLKAHGFKNILNNQRAQAFYAKWLSQYGDDSIAQMTGTHVSFWGLSQVAVKFVQDQRVGLEPIEKSTRYVNFGGRPGGKYLYYVPRRDLEKLGMLDEYRRTMDFLFDTYVALLPKLMVWLKENFKDKDSILEKKAFDTLRGLLPSATLTQVAFRGNAQAWEYLINRTARHPLGELRWVAAAVKKELDEEIPSLLLRLQDEKSQEYQLYLAGRPGRVREALANEKLDMPHEAVSSPTVKLVEWDPEAELKILAGILFTETHCSWEAALETVRKMEKGEREKVLKAYIGDRPARWYKIGRAFENSYLRFDITMNIGSYRDLQRHRMMTQDRQRFSTHHGFDVPGEIKEAGLQKPFEEAMEKAAGLFKKLEDKDIDLAQYVVPMAYRVRFYQWQNFRQLFWETELRTISQGHPDYRNVEQEKYRLVKEKFSTLAEAMQVDINDYHLPRRGTEEKIKTKEKDLIEKLGKKKRA
jgi:thymidylate synthase ThyX